MKIFKIIIWIILAVIIISFVATFVESNYCHYLTTTPPPGSPVDYIKTNILCRVNSNVALPGIALTLLWQLIF
jgi:hypothetical protein